jgi:hypothetical protein
MDFAPIFYLPGDRMQNNAGLSTVNLLNRRKVSIGGVVKIEDRMGWDLHLSEGTK